MQVLFGITDHELNVLDEFEDIEYERENVQVLLTVSHFQIHSSSISMERKMCCCCSCEESIDARTTTRHLFSIFDLDAETLKYMFLPSIHRIAQTRNCKRKPTFGPRKMILTFTVHGISRLATVTCSIRLFVSGSLHV